MVGNISNYDKLDVMRVFLRINEKISREELCKNVELGEGSIKGILNLLKNKKLISSTKKGHFLSKKGKKIRDKINKEISEIKQVKLSIFKDLKGGAILVKNLKKSVTYKERDIAIKTGAEAALLFKFKKKLFLPQCEQDIINTGGLDKLFKYRDGDTLVVVFADDKNIVERALLNVAMALNKKVERIFLMNIFLYGIGGQRTKIIKSN